MSRTRHHHHRQMHWAGPGWWHHLFFERPSRALRRRLERKALRVNDLEELDPVLWPLPRKPHIYYW